MPLSDTAASLVAERSPIGTGLLDSAGRFIQVNDALTRLLGRTDGALLGYRPDEVGLGTDPETDRRERAALLTGRVGLVRRECAVRRPAGSGSWVEVSTSVLDPVSPAVLLVHVVDTSAHRAAFERVSLLATTDPLTGLPNRREWQTRLDALLDDVRPGGTHPGDGPLGLAILDVDHFKEVNDRHGHPAGDDLLVGAARHWRDVLAFFARRGTVARLGGEEFGVLLPGLPEPVAHATVTRLCGGLPRGRTASAGLTWAVPGDDARRITARADAALAEAKHRGRARVVVRRAAVANRRTHPD